MKLRAGVKTLIGISIWGIAVGIYEIFTCPLAALLSFSIAERTEEGANGHGATMSTLHGFPVQKSELFAPEASVLVIPVFLAMIVLCYLILRQRRLQFIGVPITPQFMGLGVLLIGFWNLLFSGLLFVERVQLHYVT